MPFRIDFALYDISRYRISQEPQEHSRRVNIRAAPSCSPPDFLSGYKRQVCHAGDLESHLHNRGKELEEEKNSIPPFSNLKRNSMPAPVDICFHRCAHPMWLRLAPHTLWATLPWYTKCVQQGMSVRCAEQLCHFATDGTDDEQKSERKKWRDGREGHLAYSIGVVVVRITSRLSHVVISECEEKPENKKQKKGCQTV